MIVRLSSPAARAPFVCIAIVIVAGLSYSGIRNTLAVQSAGLASLEGYERATQLEPGNARNWYLLGRYWQYNLEAPDAQRAVRAYQRALSLDPRSADTWLDLAMAYESEGQLDSARNAFLEAKRAYPLSPEVAWRYGNFLLRRGELQAAFAEIRHAVEIDPKRGAAAFALCMRVEPDANSVLEGVLPRSQDAYLSVISALVQQEKADQALPVWSRLAALHPHLRLVDSYPLIDALIEKRLITEAHAVWEQALSFSGISRPPDFTGSLLWDGGFESDVAGRGFAWRYAPFVQGVQSTLDSREKHSGNRSLRLTFNGLLNVDFSGVCQYVAVQPSTSYRFSAWVRTDSLSTDQGLGFALRSLGGSVNSVAWTEDIRGTQPWTKIEFSWSSATDVHGVQICASRRPSAKFDSKIGGFAWIDDVSLVPDSAGQTGQ